MLVETAVGTKFGRAVGTDTGANDTGLTELTELFAVGRKEGFTVATFGLVDTVVVGERLAVGLLVGFTEGPAVGTGASPSWIHAATEGLSPFSKNSM